MIKEFFKDKTIEFYIQAGVGLLGIVGAIIYAATFAGSEYMSWMGFSFVLIAFVAFAALSIFGFSRFAVPAMAVFHFAAFVVSILKSYNYLVSFAINGGAEAALKDGKVISLIITVVILLVCCIAGNVLAWLNVRRKKQAA